MEAIAEDSEALVERVIAMAQANAVAPDPAPALSAPLDSNESDGQPGEGSTSNDVDDA